MSIISILKKNIKTILNIYFYSQQMVVYSLKVSKRLRTKITCMAQSTSLELLSRYFDVIRLFVCAAPHEIALAKSHTLLV